jgi:hypothetical protein
MSDDHVQCWHQSVQPAIDVTSPVRADKGWRWRRIFSSTGLTSYLGQRPAAFTICVQNVQVGGWNYLPCVMTALVESYPAVNARNHKSVFLWYLSTAPAPFLSSLLGSSAPRLLGSAGLDIARVRSFRLQYDGRVGLHADAGGGASLLQWYLSQGMTQLVQTAFISLARPNDGRYFFYDPTGARIAHARLDPYRT